MSTGEQNRPHQFATTHWSIVAAAGQQSSAAKQRAMTTLCERGRFRSFLLAWAGKAAQFDKLKAYLGPSGADLPYKSIAADLEMTEGSVKVAVHRLRRRCRDLLRDEIAQTVASRDEIEDELRELFAAVG